MKVKLMVNETGAIRNGRFAFQSRFSLLGELLQNSRRAGATKVGIDVDESKGVLVVTDNGCGIEDFQHLLHLNTSGWDHQIQASDRPYGLGFSQVLYSASRAHIASRGQVLEFNCEDALNQEELDVRPAPELCDGLTVIRLEGVDLSDFHIAVERFTRGYPIETTFGGNLLPRSHAEDHMEFIDTPIGRMHLSGLQDGTPSCGLVLYIQGQLLPRSSRDYYCWHGQLDVVHLDPSKFTARMPDRSELIDADKQMATIHEAIRDQWRTHLMSQKAALAAPVFIDRYFAIADRHRLLDVFNDIPLLAKQACCVVAGYPTQVAPMERYIESPLVHLDRSKQSSLAGLVRFHDRDDESAISLMYARAAGLTLVDPSLVAPGHWALEGLRRLEQEPATATPLGEVKTFSFSGHHVFCDVVLCDEIRIEHGTDSVILSDEAIFWEGRILYPKGCSDGAVVEQVSDYRDEHDRFDETACSEDFAQLARQAQLWRCPDPASMLASLLHDLSEYPTLAGKRFVVTLPSDHGKCVVEQVS